jgi:hypothetical protein
MITNNIKFAATVKVRRSIDLRELADLGSISDSASDLPTSGATDRGALGSTSATRGYVSLSTVVDQVVVDTQDMGSISATARQTLGYNDEPYQY